MILCGVNRCFSFLLQTGSAGGERADIEKASLKSDIENFKFDIEKASLKSDTESLNLQFNNETGLCSNGLALILQL